MERGIIPGETFDEWLKRQSPIFAQKDRLSKVIAEFSDRIPLAPYVQPIAALGADNKPKAIADADGIVYSWPMSKTGTTPAYVDLIGHGITHDGANGRGGGQSPETMPSNVWSGYRSIGNHTNIAGSEVRFTDYNDTNMAAAGAAAYWTVGYATFTQDIGAAGCWLLISDDSGNILARVNVPVAGLAITVPLFRSTKVVNKYLRAYVAAPPAACSWCVQITCKVT